MNELLLSIVGIVAVAFLFKVNEMSQHIYFLSNQVEELRGKIVEVQILLSEVVIPREETEPRYHKNNSFINLLWEEIISRISRSSNSDREFLGAR